ncbi:MAG: hypothetical protein M3O36_18085 [Myxococcota bacterium]|nr:hypothetical protein [Myxococcota bacterium]
MSALEHEARSAEPVQSEQRPTPSSGSCHCGDCGSPGLRQTSEDLKARGWRLLPLRDAYGNAVLWWRCSRCAGLAPKNAAHAGG